MVAQPAPAVDVSLYRRANGIWYTDCRWRGVPRLQLSTETRSKSVAQAMLRTLHTLRHERRDILGLLGAGRLHLPDVHRHFAGPAAAFDHWIRAESSALVDGAADRWLSWLALPGTLSSKTRRPYAPATIARYEASMTMLRGALPAEARMADLTPGWLADYRATRTKAGATGATLNRDAVALSAFFEWCRTVEQLAVPALAWPRAREVAAMRWLTTSEITALREASSPGWWVLWATLIYSGARVQSEAQRLWVGDVRLEDRLLRIQPRGRGRLKTLGSARDIPIATPLLTQLATLEAALGQRSASTLFFPHPFGSYQRAQRVFQATAKRAGLVDVRLHDLRHTFGVHAVLAGIPLVRIQRLMGHRTPAMTLRYMAHAPEEHYDADAARLAAQLAGTELVPSVRTA